jgi:hypothetical protein
MRVESKVDILCCEDCFDARQEGDAVHWILLPSLRRPDPVSGPDFSGDREAEKSPIF